MARKASINKNNSKKALAKKFFKYRTELREKAVNFKLSDEERDAARRKLQALPRNTSPNRVTTRCELTGRPRGYMSTFGVSRVTFREMALFGLIPGVTKASW
mgnify:CR=1 FL=1